MTVAVEALIAAVEARLSRLKTPAEVRARLDAIAAEKWLDLHDVLEWVSLARMVPVREALHLVGKAVAAEELRVFDPATRIQIPAASLRRRQ